MFVSGGAGPVGTYVPSMLHYSPDLSHLFANSFVTEYVKVIAPHVKIIASAGTAEKVEIMKSAGVDVAFNYKEQDTFAVLKEHGPIDMWAFYP